LNNAVQDALTKDIASQETDATEVEKKECLVEEIDAEVEADEVKDKAEDDDDFDRADEDKDENVEEGQDKGTGSIKVSMDNNINNYMAEE
jgi:hypothetical protein